MSVLNIHENLLEALLEMQAYSELQVLYIKQSYNRKKNHLFSAQQNLFILFD